MRTQSHRRRSAICVTSVLSCFQSLSQLALHFSSLSCTCNLTSNAFTLAQDIELEKKRVAFFHFYIFTFYLALTFTLNTLTLTLTHILTHSHSRSHRPNWVSMCWRESSCPHLRRRCCVYLHTAEGVAAASSGGQHNGPSGDCGERLASLTASLVEAVKIFAGLRAESHRREVGVLSPTDQVTNRRAGPDPPAGAHLGAGRRTDWRFQTGGRGGSDPAAQ